VAVGVKESELRQAIIRAFERVPVDIRPWNDRVADALMADERFGDEHAPDVVLVLTLHDDGICELWQRDGRTVAELAAILRGLADDFENPTTRRIR
jgi:hypothetical protein